MDGLFEAATARHTVRSVQSFGSHPCLLGISSSCSASIAAAIIGPFKDSLILGMEWRLMSSVKEEQMGL